LKKIVPDFENPNLELINNKINYTEQAAIFLKKKE